MSYAFGWAARRAGALGRRCLGRGRTRESSAERRIQASRRASTLPFTVPGGKLPSARGSPAGSPVRSARPSSTVRIGQTWNRHLALDVHHVPLPQPNARRDAVRPPEAGASNHGDREPVHLPHFRALGVDEDGSSTDLLADPLRDAPEALDLRRHRALDVLGVHHLGAPLTGGVVRLGEQVLELTMVGREPLGIGRRPRRLFDDARHALAGERTQSVPSRHSSDEARIVPGGRLVPRHVVRKVDRDLEEVGEVRIELGEQVVDRAIADQDDLEIERHRLGFELRRRHEAEQLLDRLDASFLGVQGPFQGGPRKAEREDAMGVQDEVPAVRTMERAGLQEVEVGEQRAEPGLVLGATDQGLVRRVVLVDHGGPRVRGVSDEHVDLVAAEVRPLRLAVQEPEDGVLALGRGLEERFPVFHEVLLDRREPRGHAVGGEGAELFEKVADGPPGHVLVQGPDGLSMFALPDRRLPRRVLELLAQLLDRPPDPGLILLGHLSEFIRGNDVSVADGSQPEPHRGADDADAPGAGLLGEGGECFAALCLEGLLERLATVADLLRLERSRQGDLQLDDQLVHRLAQARAFPRGQPEQPRPVRLIPTPKRSAVRARSWPRNASPSVSSAVVVNGSSAGSQVQWSAAGESGARVSIARKNVSTERVGARARPSLSRSPRLPGPPDPSPPPPLRPRPGSRAACRWRARAPSDRRSTASRSGPTARRE